MIYPNKIEVVLSYKHAPEDKEIFTERLDAEKVGEYFRLVHVPAFALNIAYGDVVKVEFDEGEYHFEALIEESGYSVVHIVIFKPDSKGQCVATLNQLNCRVNTHVADHYLVISVPPRVTYKPVQDYLLKEQKAGNIDFRESCLSKMHVPPY